MNRSFSVLFALLALLPARALVAAEAKPIKKEHGKDFFDQLKLRTVHVHVTANGWATMEPVAPVNRGGLMAALSSLSRAGAKPATQPTTQPEKPRYVEGQRIKGTAFGYEFAYVKAAVDIDGESFKDVGMRFKGNGSFSASRNVIRKPFKLDFDRFDDKLKFHGLTTLNFANNAWDASQLRETLSYETFRAAGVPAPRTALAAVYLTVDGKYDREYIGLYTIVEDVGKKFLKTHFGSSDGLLMKPEGVKNLPFLGEDFSRYIRQYRPKTEQTPKTTARLIEFTKLIHQADDATFNSRIEEVMDVDNFMRFLATTTILSSLDCFMINGHNFYLYIDATDNKVHWLPWDMHISLGGFVWLGGGSDQTVLSIEHPFVGDDRLIQRMLAIPKYDKIYRDCLKELATGAFSPQRMNQRIDQLQPLVAKAEDLAKVAGRVGSPTTAPAVWGRANMPQAPEIRTFIAGRTKSVLAQLAGDKTGVYLPSFANRNMAPPPLPPADIALLATTIMRQFDTDQDQVITLPHIHAAITRFYAVSDTAKRGWLDVQMVASTLKQILPPPLPAAANAPKPMLPRETLLAQAIVRQADTNRVGGATLPDLKTLATRLFSQSDRNRDGALDQVELSAALRQLVMARQ